jgi:hypothetical protein
LTICPQEVAPLPGALLPHGPTRVSIESAGAWPRQAAAGLRRRSLLEGPAANCSLRFARRCERRRIQSFLHAFRVQDAAGRAPEAVFAVGAIAQYIGTRGATVWSGPVRRRLPDCQIWPGTPKTKGPSQINALGFFMSRPGTARDAVTCARSSLPNRPLSRMNA